MSEDPKLHEELNEWDLAALAEAHAKKAAETAAAARAAADAKAQREYEEAAKGAGAAAKDSGYTNKRDQDIIFKREMEEPEFWLTKEGLIPPRIMLTPEEETAISARVEVPTNQIPEYSPQLVLSPEYYGVSNYEIGVGGFRDELERELERARADPGSSKERVVRLENDLKKMDTLYENYHIGMNVFRTAKGGRERAK